MSNNTFISFNINGIRARFHQIAAITEKHQPLLIGLQETKVLDDMFPKEAMSEFGYLPLIHGQKGHYGVAILLNQKLMEAQKCRLGEVIKGFPGDKKDAQRRFIGVELISQTEKSTWVYNGYFPQGEGRAHPVKFPAKEAFYADLFEFLSTKHTTQENVILMGDMNISPEDIDIGIGENNAKRWLRTGKSSFLPEEREWYQRLMSFGFVDSFRQTFPDEHRLSWFDYRSRGFEQEPKHGLRIDHILLSEELQARQIDVGIDHDIRGMEKPSDHCPIWVTLSL